MAGNLELIKQRLRSIDSIHKITSAMRLVATANLRLARVNLNAVQDYYITVYEVIKELSARLTEQQFKKINNIGPDHKNTLYIVVSSDLGFCGSYNNEVRKLFFKNYQKGDAVLLVGHYLEKTFQNHDINVVETFDGGNTVDLELAKLIDTIALSTFRLKKYANFEIIYTKFVNSITFKPTILHLWPLDHKKLKDVTTNHLYGAVERNGEPTPLSNIEFEPDIEQVFQKTSSLYSTSIIYGALLESKVSEHGSRLIAMDSASNNADELKEELILKKNRLRQAKITQEISEIISSVEASSKST